MKAIRHFIFLLVLCIAAFSCKKKKQPEQIVETKLPNFGNIDLDKVFNRKDNKLENKYSIISVLESYYQNVWENGNLWGGFLVAKGDEILIEKYRGFAKGDSLAPINDSVALHVASISKSVTAMAVLKLVDAGQLQLNDPVTKFFPKFPYPKVTVLTLLNQRSGLPKYEYMIEKLKPEPKQLSKKFLTNRDILDILIEYKPDLSRETDTGFMYCNTNYALLALIIEEVTKETFPEAMKQMVFQPLAMEHSFIFQEKDTLSSAKSFYQRGPRVFPYDRLDLIYGDKNLYTTPRDLLNFSKAMYSKHFLKPELMDMIFEPYSNEKPGINNYGLGFRMKIFDEGNKLTYHNGWWHGSNTVFAHLLNSNVTIIAIGNKYSQRVYSALALSALFEDFPYETEKLRKQLNETDTAKVASDADSAATDAE